MLDNLFESPNKDNLLDKFVLWLFILLFENILFKFSEYINENSKEIFYSFKL